MRGREIKWCKEKNKNELLDEQEMKEGRKATEEQRRNECRLKTTRSNEGPDEKREKSEET